MLPLIITVLQTLKNYLLKAQNTPRHQNECLRSEVYSYCSGKIRKYNQFQQGYFEHVTE